MNSVSDNQLLASNLDPGEEDLDFFDSSQTPLNANPTLSINSDITNLPSTQQIGLESEILKKSSTLDNDYQSTNLVNPLQDMSTHSIGPYKRTKTFGPSNSNTRNTDSLQPYS